MKNRILLLILLGSALFVSCVERINNEMHEMVRSKEHDERLFGWWQFCNDENEYIYYDDIEYKEFYGIRNEDGTIEKEANSYTYWYTENGVLYTLMDATPLTGIIDAYMEYKISEDGNTFLTRYNERDEFTPAKIRVLNVE